MEKLENGVTLGWSKPTKSASTRRPSTVNVSLATEEPKKKVKSKSSNPKKVEVETTEKKPVKKVKSAKKATPKKVESSAEQPKVVHEVPKPSLETPKKKKVKSSVKKSEVSSAHKAPPEWEEETIAKEAVSDDEFDSMEDEEKETFFSSLKQSIMSQKYPLLTLIVCIVIAIILADVIFAVSGSLINAIAVIGGVYLLYVCYRYFAEWREKKKFSRSKEKGRKVVVK